MPADLTAAQLIAILREHPLTCGALTLKVTNTDGNHEDIRIKSDGGRVAIYGDDAKEFAVDFGLWLTGALVDAHVERGIMLPDRAFDEWGVIDHAGNETRYATILHAMLAGLESNLKETTNG